MAKSFSPRLCLAAALLCAAVVGPIVAAEPSSTTMRNAELKLLKSLNPEQLQQARFSFEADERLHWHFIPTETFPRRGLLLRDMTPTQRQLAHDLMKAGLSQRGYLTPRRSWISRRC
jgi:hypothetical protein